MLTIERNWSGGVLTWEVKIEGAKIICAVAATVWED